MNICPKITNKKHDEWCVISYKSFKGKVPLKDDDFVTWSTHSAVSASTRFFIYIIITIWQDVIGRFFSVFSNKNRIELEVSIRVYESA